MHRPSWLFVLPLILGIAVTQCQSSAQQVEVAPPAPRVQAPSPDATVAELDKHGDELRGLKYYLDAIDYYEAALKKEPRNASLQNKIGIAYLQLQNLKNANKYFKNAIRSDRAFADAYNNLGVVYYMQKNYRKAIQQYQAALKVRPDSAAYYGNLGAAYFARKETEKAVLAYIYALQLDPNVLSHSSRAGVIGQTTPQEERAFYDYVVAKAYAKMGLLDQSLQHLKRAMEEQYKDIDKVYKDTEFAALRKDPRFAELMANKPPALPE